MGGMNKTTNVAPQATQSIRINGRRLWLDLDRTKSVRGWCGDSEQCEECGCDIVETGEVIRRVHGSTVIRCMRFGCTASYHVETAGAK